MVLTARGRQPGGWVCQQAGGYGLEVGCAMVLALVLSLFRTHVVLLYSSSASAPNLDPIAFKEAALARLRNAVCVF